MVTQMVNWVPFFPVDLLPLAAIFSHVFACFRPLVIFFFIFFLLLLVLLTFFPPFAICWSTFLHRLFRLCCLPRLPAGDVRAAAAVPPGPSCGGRRGGARALPRLDLLPGATGEGGAEPWRRKPFGCVCVCACVCVCVCVCVRFFVFWSPVLFWFFFFFPFCNKHIFSRGSLKMDVCVCFFFWGGGPLKMGDCPSFFGSSLKSQKRCSLATSQTPCLGVGLKGSRKETRDRHRPRSETPFNLVERLA